MSAPTGMRPGTAGLHTSPMGQLSSMEPTAARGDQTDPVIDTGDNLVETRGDERNAAPPAGQDDDAGGDETPPESE